MIGRILRAVLAVLVFFYATQNIRPVPPHAYALVLRFGKLVRTQDAGILVAWPPPLERVVIIPDAERQLLQLTPGPTLMTETVAALTSDQAAITLGATVDIGRPSRIAGTLLAAATLQAISRHSLAVLSASPQAAIADAEKILATGFDLPIPPRVSLAMSAAPDAGAGDDGARLLAAARAEAAAKLQQTDAARVRMFTDAHARATERVAFARAATATMNALQSRITETTRPAVLEDLYRQKIAAILHQAGSVSTVDAKSVSRLIIPGSPP
jgi:regulator of protease activity HflC (stomatin/prohibitin superfamily)